MQSDRNFCFRQVRVWAPCHWNPKHVAIHRGWWRNFVWFIDSSLVLAWVRAIIVHSEVRFFIVKEWKTDENRLSWYAKSIISISSWHWTHWTQIMLLWDIFSSFLQSSLHLDVRCWTQRSWASEVGRRASVDSPRKLSSMATPKQHPSNNKRIPEISRQFVVLVDIM